MFFLMRKISDAARIRTQDFLRNRQILYQLGYQGAFIFVYQSSNMNELFINANLFYRLKHKCILVI